MGIMLNRAAAGSKLDNTENEERYEDRAYEVDRFGFVNIADDDAEWAKGKGFEPFIAGALVPMVDENRGAREKREIVAGKPVRTRIPPGGWESSHGHQYQCDDAGQAKILECDVAEAEAAGFKRA